MQKSIIINSVKTQMELDSFLNQNWKVVHLCPMPSSVAIASSSWASKDYPPTCLVIIEKE